MKILQNRSELVSGRRLIGLSENELTGRLKDAVVREKTATLLVLEYLGEVERRRLYAAQSYSTLFEYVVKELGYSEMQASERINSMRLLNEVPEVKDMLTKGELSMTTASQIHRFIRNEKRFAPEPLNEAEKQNVIKLCANQSKREVEKILFKLQSDESKVETAERVRMMNETHAELRFLVPEGVLKLIDEVRNLNGESSLSAIFTDALETHVSELRKKRHASSGLDSQSTFPGKSEDKMRSYSSRARYVPWTIKRMLFVRSGGQCEFVDPASKNRCLSRFRIEIDHIVPFAAGGKTEVNNLRHLCPNHNKRSAYEWFSNTDFKNKNGPAH